MTVDVVVMVVMSFRTVGVGMIVGVIVTMVCRGVIAMGVLVRMLMVMGVAFCAVAVL